MAVVVHDPLRVHESGFESFDLAVLYRGSVVVHVVRYRRMFTRNVLIQISELPGEVFVLCAVLFLVKSRGTDVRLRKCPCADRRIWESSFTILDPHVVLYAGVVERLPRMITYVEGVLFYLSEDPADEIIRDHIVSIDELDVLSCRVLESRVASARASLVLLANDGAPFIFCLERCRGSVIYQDNFDLVCHLLIETREKLVCVSLCFVVWNYDR